MKNTGFDGTKISEDTPKDKLSEIKTQEAEGHDEHEDSEVSSPQPVGQGSHVVKPGNCISSIAEKTGHFWQTLWNHPNNLDVKMARENPNVLLPGDKIFIPDIQSKEEFGQTENRHRFRRKGVPSIMVVQICEDGEPKANKPYQLQVDGRLVSGQTDGEGRIEISIPGGADKAELLITDGDEQLSYVIQLGTLDPCDTVKGLQQRLNNLGIYRGPIDGKLSAVTKAAIMEFQHEHNLQPTGQPDQRTYSELRGSHEV